MILDTESFVQAKCKSCKDGATLVKVGDLESVSFLSQPLMFKNHAFEVLPHFGVKHASMQTHSKILDVKKKKTT